MIIHIVQPGETVDSIATYYGINKERLIFDNDITNYNKLVVGQAIVIVYPNQVYTVKEGDTIESIAKMYNITVLTLVRNNSFLLDREVIAGEELVISYQDEKLSDIYTNGYAYPYIGRDILRKNLLYLTYLSIFSYSINPDGTLREIDDLELINMAKEFGVAPVMVISGASPEGNINMDFLHNFINNEDMRSDIINMMSQIAYDKGYYAINVDTPYIRAEDRQIFSEFIQAFTEKAHSYGIKLFITLTPNSFGEQDREGENFTDYVMLGNIVDEIVLLSYSWGYTSEIPLEAAPVSVLEILLQYVVAQIPPEKITVGLSSIGYIVEFPPIEGVTRASSISNTNAINLAGETGAQIEFNQSNQSSYFFVSENSRNYFVYFHDIRGVDYALSRLLRNGVNGIGIWNVMYYLAQTFFLINTQYNIVQVTS